MTRYRIVTHTSNARGREEHISSVILSHEEALDSLDVEERIASLAGWDTVRLETFGGTSPTIVCSRGLTTRTLTVRASDPFDDQIT